MKDQFKNTIRYLRAQKTNIEVKKFIRENKKNNVSFEKNVWSKNWYWDYYIQRHSESERSKFYVPFDYFVYKIQPKINDYRYAVYVDDKNLYDRLFKGFGVALPKTLFRCYNGIFMDQEYNIIDDVSKYIGSIKENVFVKQSIDSQGGKGVDKYVYTNGKLMSYEEGSLMMPAELISKFSNNFIVQEELQQHEKLSRLHPSSINTVRVHTYRSFKTNEVHVLMTSIRTGIDNACVDNVSRGGLSIGTTIDKDNEARLKKTSFRVFSNESFSVHPNSKIEFNEYKIPHFDLIVKAIGKLSNVIPFQRNLSWDFTVNPEGKPVLIELNRIGGIWAAQETNGKPYFGDFSQEVWDVVNNKN